jgi:hypothetical protein
MADEEFEVTDESLSSFTDKLNEWGKGLNVGEQALLQVILTRAGAEAPDVEGFSFGTAQFGASAASFLSPMVSSRAISVRAPGAANAGAWVELGDPWAKSSPGVFRAL